MLILQYNNDNCEEGHKWSKENNYNFDIDFDTYEDFLDQVSREEEYTIIMMEE